MRPPAGGARRRATCLLALLLVAGLAARRQAREGYVRAADGVRLFYRVIGSGSDTIIALHGGPGLDMGYMLPDLMPLGRSHTVIFYDQRGAGRSTVVADSTRITPEAHIADLDAVRHYFHIDRAILLGHSWGAALAARYALAHRLNVAKLILVDAMPPRATPWMQRFSEAVRAWMDPATRARLDAISATRDTATDRSRWCRAYWAIFIRGYFANPADTAMIGRMRGDVCTAPADAQRNSARVNALTVRPFGDWDWRNDFHTLRMPVLVIHGSNDPIPLASAREWVAAFPSARLVVLQHAGHFSYVEQPAAFFNAVDDFLR